MNRIFQLGIQRDRDKLYVCLTKGERKEEAKNLFVITKGINKEFSFKEVEEGKSINVSLEEFEKFIK